MSTYMKVILGIVILLVIGNIVYLYFQYKVTLEVVFSPEELKTHDLFVKHEEAIANRIQKKAAELPQGSFSLGANEKSAKIFMDFYRQMKDNSTFRVKIYDKKLTVVWSNLQELIGKNYVDDEDLQEVIQEGKVVGEVKSSKEEQLTERDFANFSEVIVPIKDQSGQVVGVVESYQSIEEIVSQVKNEFMLAAVKSIGVSLAVLVLVAVGGKFFIH